MALVLDASVGGASSNTYLTLAEAEAYHESRLHNTAWTGATDANKNIALVEATRYLDGQCRYKGYKKDEDQALEWPRSEVYDRNGYYLDNDIIPQPIKNAVAELAMWLLDKDRTSEQANPGGAGIEEVSVAGAVSVKFNSKDRLEVVPSEQIDNILMGLGTVNSTRGGAVQLMRT